MGVFSDRLFAVFLIAMPWRRTNDAVDECRRPGNAGECDPQPPSWQTWDMQCPNTSSMRADLEALRTYTRVR